MPVTDLCDSGRYSSLSSAFHSGDLMPKTKLLGSNPGAEAIATMSPFVMSITTAEALCPAIRRIA